MKRVLWLAVIGFALMVLAVAAWWYRPWSPYSPATVMASREEPDRAPIYRAMNDYFPNRKIEGAADAAPLPRALEPLDIRYNFGGETISLDDYADRNAITGLMIVREGTVVFEEYWRGETADDLHTSWSVAKSFIATLVGAAIEDGRIDSIDDPVENYAKLYQGTDYGKVTLRELLMMSSGIDFIEDYETRGSDMRKLFFNTFILNRDIERFVRQYDQNREPQKDFDYLSPNTTVLGAVVSAAYDGRTLSDLASEKIFKPAGMQGGTWLLDRNSDKGHELAYCCIQIRLEDFAKFGMLYLADGVADGDRIFPEGWRQFVSHPPDPGLELDGTEGTNGYGYGHHFWVPFDSDGEFFAAGYNGQFVWIDPNRNVVIAITSADQGYPLTNKEPFWLMKSAAKIAAEYGK